MVVTFSVHLISSCEREIIFSYHREILACRNHGGHTDLVLTLQSLFVCSVDGPVFGRLSVRLPNGAYCKRFGVNQLLNSGVKNSTVVSRHYLSPIRDFDVPMAWYFRELELSTATIWTNKSWGEPIQAKGKRKVDALNRPGKWIMSKAWNSTWSMESSTGTETISLIVFVWFGSSQRILHLFRHAIKQTKTTMGFFTLTITMLLESCEPREWIGTLQRNK
jgi:hypothetical protein